MHLAQTMAETYSLAELETTRKALLDALLAPESITGEQLDGVSFSFAPKSPGELSAVLAQVRAAIAILQGQTAPSVVRGRFIDFSTRPLE